MENGYTVNVLSAGEKYPSLATKQDAISVVIDDNGVSLYYLLNGWTSRETLQTLPNRPIRFRWSVLYNVGFLSMKVGDLPWSDCPFHPVLLEKDKPAYDTIFPQKMGYPCMLYFVDSSNGLLKSIRMIGLGETFSKTVQEWCRKQLDAPLTLTEYDRIVDAVYRKISSDEIATVASASFDVGV